jgi:hypothetical protein
MAHLAIAGGEPIRRTPFPRWPFWNQEEVEAVQAVVESGRWGAQQGGEVRHFEAEFAAYQEAAHGIAVTKVRWRSAGPHRCWCGTRGQSHHAGLYFCRDGHSSVGLVLYRSLPISIHRRILLIQPARGMYHAPHPGAPASASRRAARHGGHHGPGTASQSGWLIETQRRPEGLLAKTYGRHLGHVAGFSLSSKNITAGEGGMILSNDAAIGAMARSLSNCGRQPDGLWYALCPGRELRLSELHGAILRVQLRQYPEQLARRPMRPIWSKGCQRFQASRRYARTHG